MHKVAPLFLILALVLSCIGPVACGGGNECDEPSTLEVKVMSGGLPVVDIEVDIWTSSAPDDSPPDVGRFYTDENGIVSVEVPAGYYEIGFNRADFPEYLVFPNGDDGDDEDDEEDEEDEEDLVQVKECETTTVTIQLQRG